VGKIIVIVYSWITSIKVNKKINRKMYKMMIL